MGVEQLREQRDVANAQGDGGRGTPGECKGKVEGQDGWLPEQPFERGRFRDAAHAKIT